MRGFQDLAIANRYALIGGKKRHGSSVHGLALSIPRTATRLSGLSISFAIANANANEFSLWQVLAVATASEPHQDDDEVD